VHSQRRAIRYSDGDVPLSGVLVTPDIEPTTTPGILLLHGGAGLDAHAEQQAQRYAGIGYVVLAADLYGEDVRGDRDRVMATLNALVADPSLLVGRATAGLAQLSARLGDASRVAAIGFCFGGLVALALARAGADLAGAVSIHGSLRTSRPARPGVPLPRILVCHGGRDPFVPLSDVHDFATEMLEADAEWSLVVHGRARHGFTHRDADPAQNPGVAYDEAADRQSFAVTRDFLAETFARTAHPDGPSPP
jgi:dienelactone hydrolase